MTVSEEEKELGLLYLRNAFWQQFSALVNGYVAAIGYLELEDSQLLQMGDLTSVYGVDRDEPPDFPAIGVRFANNKGKGVTTLQEALENPKAVKIYIAGKLAATRREDGWYFEV